MTVEEHHHQKHRDILRALFAVKPHEMMARHLVSRGFTVSRDDLAFLERRYRGMRMVDAVVGDVGSPLVITPAWPADAESRTPLQLGLWPSPWTIEDADQDGKIGNCWYKSGIAACAIGAVAFRDGTPLTPDKLVLPNADPALCTVPFYGGANGATQTNVVVAPAFDAIVQGPLETPNGWGKLHELAFAYARTGADLFYSESSGWFSEAYTDIGAKIITSPIPAIFNVTDPTKMYAALAAALQGNLVVHFGTGDSPTNGIPGDHGVLLLPWLWQTSPKLGLDPNKQWMWFWNQWGRNFGGGAFKVDVRTLVPSALQGSFGACNGVAAAAPITFDPNPPAPSPSPSPTPSPEPTPMPILTGTLVPDHADGNYVVGDTIRFAWTAQVNGAPPTAANRITIASLSEQVLPSAAAGSYQETATATRTFNATLQIDAVQVATVRIAISSSPAPSPTPVPTPTPTPAPGGPVTISCSGPVTVSIGGQVVYQSS